MHRAVLQAGEEEAAATFCVEENLGCIEVSTGTVEALLNADFTMRTTSPWNIPREMVDAPVLDTEICLTGCWVIVSGLCFCQKGWSR